MVSFSSCKKYHDTSSVEKKMMKEKNEMIVKGEKLIKEYLELNMQGKIEEASKYFSDKHTEKRTIEGEEDVFPTGYYLERLEYIGDSLVAEVKLYLSELDKPYYIIQKLKYTISKEITNDMKIVSIEDNGSVEFFGLNEEDKYKFMFREGDVTNKEPIFKSDELPPLVSISSSSDPGMKVKITGKNFGSVAISEDRNEMVIVGKEENGSILLTIDKSKSAFKENMKLAEGNDGGGGLEDAKESGDKEKEAETEVVALDYFENSDIEHVCFSPGGDVVFARIKTGDKIHIALYSVFSNGVSAPRVMKKFNSPDYKIIDSYFNDENILILNVLNSDSKNETYRVNVKEDEIIKETNKKS